MGNDHPFRREKAAPRWLLAAGRRLRREQTKAERILWEELRDRKLDGVKFRRQAIMEHFVLDFYCHAHRLLIELDGPIHLDPDIAAYDAERQAFIQAMGIRVLRFTNDQIENHTNDVLTSIRRHLLPDEARG
jgi:very-short-patch-repair endonuclease